MTEIVPAHLRDPNIRTEFVEANGQRFEVDMCGSGTRLAICLHGFPEHSFSWRFQLPMLADLGYQAWAPNLRGYGNSSKPEGTSAYSIELLMEDVAQLIDASGCQETVLLAHDWGAVIAWYFAMRKIRPLQNLVICNVPHPQAMNNQFSWAQFKKSWYILFFQIPQLPEWLMGRNDAQAMANVMRNSAIDEGNFTDEIGEVYRRNATQPGALTAMLNYYRGLLSGGGAKRQRELGYTKIDTPTLMVWGEDDVALTKQTTYGTEQYVTDFTIRYLPRVSHWVQQEQPEVVNAMIGAFLRGQPVPQMQWQAQLLPPQLPTKEVSP